MKKIVPALAVLVIGFLFQVMTASENTAQPDRSESTIVLGGGCFWCIEALYEALDGVTAVRSGYAGGHVENPSYTQVTSGKTGHAEVVEVRYDPRQVSLEELLDFFWKAHDPTTLNRQGADVGPQYRSIILPADEAQRAIAEASMKAAASRFSSPIVTEIKDLVTFYEAEAYHQDFYDQNPNAPYCQFVIAPKLKKLES